MGYKEGASGELPSALEAMRSKLLHAPQYADEVHERERRRQLELMREVRGKVVHDIARVEEKRTGDDVFLWFLTQKAVPVADERVIVLVLLVEQKRQNLKLEEVRYRDGAYFLADGTNFVAALVDGDYNY